MTTDEEANEMFAAALKERLRGGRVNPRDDDAQPDDQDTGDADGGAHPPLAATVNPDELFSLTIREQAGRVASSRDAGRSNGNASALRRVSAATFSFK